MKKKTEEQAQSKTPWLRIKRLDDFSFELEEVSEDSTIKSIAKDVFPICLDKANELLLRHAGVL
jgi:hypothetical protein